MSKVRIHCYGCSATVAVDPGWAAEGLRAARWATDHGQTFCAACAERAALPDPWLLDSAEGRPWADYGTRRPSASSAVASETTPTGPAIDDAMTRAALKAYGSRAWRWLGAGAALLAVTLAFTEIHAHEASQLLRTGIRTLGVVGGYEPRREGAEMLVRYRADGLVHEGAIGVSSSERYEHEPGEQVVVIYDPTNPSRIRTPTDSNQGRLTWRVEMYGFVFAVLLLLSGLTVMMRPFRWRRILRVSWKPYALTYIPGNTRRAAPGVKLVPTEDPGAEPVVLRLSGVVRQRAAKLAGEPVLWMAGDPAASVVLAIPRTRELFPAAAPRGWTGRKWLEAQEPTSARERRAFRVLFLLAIVSMSAVAVTAAKHHNWLGALVSGVYPAIYVLLRARGRARRS